MPSQKPQAEFSPIKVDVCHMSMIYARFLIIPVRNIEHKFHLQNIEKNDIE